MFSIFKKKEALTFSKGYFPILTDIHSHILPGIDDGSPTIETSLELIEGLMKLGIKKSIATPHIIGDLYRNDDASINTALALLKNALAEKNINFCGGDAPNPGLIFAESSAKVDFKNAEIILGCINCTDDKFQSTKILNADKALNDGRVLFVLTIALYPTITGIFE